MTLAPGARLGPYEILSALGAGGMGQVWKARDTRLDRLVAIKKSEIYFCERFDREARAIAAVNHPHVCSLYDVGPDYLVMEYVEGEWLRGPVPIARALVLADQILDAIDAAHRKGIVHRDLKPGNILLTKSGVKVLDFGLAKVGHAPAADAGNGRSRRHLEYICSDATLLWLDKEVLPLARKQLKLLDLKKSAGTYGVLGASAGGIMAVYTGLRMPEVFGKVLSQSGVFSLEGRDLIVKDLVRYRHAPDLRIWMDIGTFDELLEDNRRMVRLLQEQQYQVSYREFSGGHNYTAWRDDVWRGLQEMFS